MEGRAGVDLIFTIRLIVEEICWQKYKRVYTKFSLSGKSILSYDEGVWRGREAKGSSRMLRRTRGMSPWFRDEDTEQDSNVLRVCSLGCSLITRMESCGRSWKVT